MKQNNLSITISISEIMLKKLDRLVKLESATRSEVIRNALRDYLNKKLLELGEKV